MLNIRVSIAGLTRPALELNESDQCTNYVLVVENPAGSIVGCFEYDDEVVAETAFDATIGSKVCLYKQECRTTLIRCH